MVRTHFGRRGASHEGAADRVSVRRASPAPLRNTSQTRLGRRAPHSPIPNTHRHGRQHPRRHRAFLLRRCSHGHHRNVCRCPTPVSRALHPQAPRHRPAPNRRARKAARASGAGIAPYTQCTCTLHPINPNKTHHIPLPNPIGNQVTRLSGQPFSLRAPYPQFACTLQPSIPAKSRHTVRLSSLG